jgi:hypothetical protein
MRQTFDCEKHQTTWSKQLGLFLRWLVVTAR